jgi:iron complex outermembrane receptor protein
VRAAAPPGFHLGDAAVDLFGFFREANDLIAYQTSSLNYVRPYNVGAARVTGAELAATVSPVRWVRLDLSATVTVPLDVSPGRMLANDLLPYQPRLVLAPRVELGAPVPGRIVRSAKVAAAYVYESARYADPAGLDVLRAQGSLDLDGEIELLDARLVLRGRVANLFDQTRRDFIGYPLPGRAGYLTLEARW